MGLIGDVTVWLGDRQGSVFDTGMGPGYAQQLSKKCIGVVRWKCSNGDPTNVLYFEAGVDVTQRERALTAKEG